MRLSVGVAIGLLCSATGGCGLLDGAGFGDEEDYPACVPPKGVQTVEEYAKQVCRDDNPPLFQDPTADQNNEILSMIDKFDLKWSFDLNRFGPATLSVCISLYGDATPAEIAPHAAEWFGRDDHKLSLEQSRSVVDLIQKQGWCTR